ncbi:hypothetical protein GCM10009616_18400 [Microlunatus lacustris]
MDLSTPLCPECRSAPLPPGTHGQERETCSDRCRARRYRRLHREREALADAARDLLLRQTRAVIAGSDPAVMAEIAAEAERIFGPDGELRFT